MKNLLDESERKFREYPQGNTTTTGFYGAGYDDSSDSSSANLAVGEGEGKVSLQTIEISCRLAATFPPYVVLSGDLDIDVTPFGSIDFGWVLKRDVMMNIIVIPSGEIGFSYSVHGDRGSGNEPWEGTLPRRISQAFDKVFNRKQS